MAPAEVHVQMFELRELLQALRKRNELLNQGAVAESDAEVFEVDQSLQRDTAGVYAILPESLARMRALCQNYIAGDY